MKYNEEQLKQLYADEVNIWHADDLDWFDQNLADRLQNNKLPAAEKQKLIDMMANDQAVLNRYLQLKQQTITIKPSFFQTLKDSLVPIMASGVAVLFAVVLFINNGEDSIDFSSDIVRGIPASKSYPPDATIINTAPEYFIINNPQAQELQLTLVYNDKNIWSSDYQKSSKFYLPVLLRKQLEQGHYIWTVKNKDRKIREKNSFVIQ